jgi:hypothetical protein
MELNDKKVIEEAVKNLKKAKELGVKLSWWLA